MFYLILSFFVPFLLYYIYKIYYNWTNYWSSRKIKKMNVSFIKNLITSQPMTKSEVNMYEQVGNESFAGLTSINYQALVVKDLDVLKRIMIKDFEYFTSIKFDHSGNEDDYMDSMVSGHKNWKQLRATLSPLFSTGKIRRMFSTFDNCGQNFIKYLQNISEDGSKPIQVQSAIERYTMSVIASAVFCIDANLFTTEDSIFLKRAREMLRFNFRRILKLMALLMFPFLVKIKFLKLSFLDIDAQGYFANIIKERIRSREKSPEKWNDFLQLLLEQKQSKNLEIESEKLEEFEKDAQIANIKSKLELDERTIVAACLQFLFAGFDPTETLLTWALYELALNPDIQEKLRNQLLDVKEEKDGLDYDSVMNLSYLDNVINETLRKFPPSLRAMRVVDKPYKLEETGTYLEKGIQIIIPIYAIHHDPNIWENPDVFDPERFATKENRNSYAWIPFGSGPRNCLGMRFAIAEAKTMLSNILVNFKIEPTSKTQIPIKFAFSVFVKPKDPLELKFTPIQ